MITLKNYLAELDADLNDPEQLSWYDKLRQTVSEGESIHTDASPEWRNQLAQTFCNWVRTEELKAWYGEPEGNSLFQGTSVSSLTIPCVLDQPLRLTGIEALERSIAEHYILLHDQHESAVRRAILESVDKWMSEGIFYGIALGSKIITQAFGMTTSHSNVIFPVDGVMVDPHQITRYSPKIRKAYFKSAKERIDCLADLQLSQTEFEQCLVLADISKPKIDVYRDKLMLAPIRCNEIAAVLSRRVTRLVRELSGGRISPRSLMITIYDTDTPYTYHQVSGYAGNPLAPVLPGLLVLGSSGSIDAFRWLYAYRISLLAQKIMKSSLWSQVGGKFIPFIYFGVLVERDAAILLDLDNLGKLRYPGMISPSIEYSYLLPKLHNYISETPISISPVEELRNIL